MKFHDGQYQFKVSSIKYADFEANLKIQLKDPLPTQKAYTLEKSINTFPLAFVFIVSLLLERLRIQ